jgi:dethiobiotin synthetase
LSELNADFAMSHIQNYIFPKARGLFITGTDTGVGKTLITGGIARLLVRGGLRVGVFKPIATGCRSEMGALVSEDAAFLAMCAEMNEPQTAVVPVCYRTPAAPLAAARAEKKSIDFEQIAAMYRYLCGRYVVVLVEGIGGAMVPLDAETTVMDLAAAMGLPTVIVARPGLGTINHTLLTIRAVREAGLPLAGVVISGYNAATADTAEETAPGIIAEIGKTSILAIVGQDEESSVERGILGGMVLAGLGERDWASLIES